jgi:hypothetical protein
MGMAHNATEEIASTQTNLVETNVLMGISDALRSEFSKVNAYHVVATTMVSETETTFEVGFSGMAGISSYTFKKIDDEWKLDEPPEH